MQGGYGITDVNYGNLYRKYFCRYDMDFSMWISCVRPHNMTYNVTSGCWHVSRYV